MGLFWSLPADVTREHIKPLLEEYDIALLLAAHGVDFVIPPRFTEWAARRGYVDCLRYAHESGCEWHILTTYSAANVGSLECLQYAHKVGAKWYSGTMRIAQRNGHIECVDFCKSRESLKRSGGIYGEQN